MTATAPPEALTILVDATATIADLDRQRGEQTIRRRLAVTSLRAQGWSLQRIADEASVALAAAQPAAEDPPTLSKAAVSQIERSTK